MPAVGKRFRDALVWAAELHEDQKRKGGDVPYVSHLIGVAAIVLEHGGTEDQAIGALLHDALEDQAHKMSPNEIRARFGDRVEAIVEACTDGNPEEQHDRDPARWRVRKQIYIDQVATKPADALLVSMADKLYNARAILEDFREIGDKLWPRFTAGRVGNLWYYRALLTAFKARLEDRPGGGIRLWHELDRTVAEIERLAGG
ncbi:MAG: HD domain-containing protein [Betaproteobacteria bacterium]